MSVSVVNERWCNKCKSWLPEDYFRKLPSGGRSVRCQLCNDVQQMQHNLSRSIEPEPARPTTVPYTITCRAHNRRGCTRQECR